MKNYFKMLMFLGIISALSGLIIGYVNSVVEPIIIENEFKAERMKLEMIFPESEFTAIEYQNDTVLKVYSVEGKGHIVKTTGIGFNSSEPIVILVGFDTDGNVIDVKALSQQETNGFGSKCFEEENIKNIYVGRSLDEEVDMISGATFTSTAMRNMITAAQAAVKEVR